MEIFGGPWQPWAVLAGFPFAAVTYQWSQMSSHRAPTLAARFGGWSGTSSCHEEQLKASKWRSGGWPGTPWCHVSQLKASKWNTVHWIIPTATHKAALWEEQGRIGTPRKTLRGHWIPTNDCSLIPMSNLLPVINRCSCMCLQQKGGGHSPAFLILQHVLGGDGAQLLPGPLSWPSCDLPHPQHGQSSLSSANPPLELSWHASLMDKMKYHSRVFTRFGAVTHFLIDHLNFRIFFPGGNGISNLPETMILSHILLMGLLICKSLLIVCP